MRHHTQILSSATSLFGLDLFLIGALKLSHQAPLTYSDEIAGVAAAFLFIAIFLSYLAHRNDGSRAWQIRIADGALIVGLLLLALSIIVRAVQLQ